VQISTRGLSDWVPSAFNSSIWVTSVPKGLPPLRQLYVNGVRAVRTKGNATELLGNLTTTGLGYTAQNHVKWRNPQHVELLYLAQLMPWTAHRCAVSSLSADGHTISVEQPCFKNLGPRGQMCDPHNTKGCTAVYSFVRWWLSGLPSHVVNAFELLASSQPGTFYHDLEAAELYYTPRTDEWMATAEVVAPVLQTLFQAERTRGIHLRGIAFEHSSWWLEKDGYGYTPVQGGWHNVAGKLSNEFAWACNPPFTQPNCPNMSRLPGGVVFNDAIDSVVSKCAFRRLGGSGLDIVGSSHHNSVAGCLFEDISGAGVQIGGGDPCPNCPECRACPDCVPPSGEACPVELSHLMNYNNSVEDTVVSNTTLEFQDTLGIWAGYTRGLRLEHNNICRTHYGGISVGWGWSGWDIASKYCYSRDNELAYNQISDVSCPSQAWSPAFSFCCGRFVFVSC
jgi:hypothetical protein